MNAAPGHVTAEAAAFIESSLGARPGAMDRFSTRELELLFDVVTSPAGALLQLSFIEIGTAAETSPDLLARTFDQCLEWEDLWLTSAALDHPNADDAVVARAVDAFLRLLPTEPVRTEEFSVSIVIRRLCETSRLTTNQIDRMAQTSLLVAEQLTYGLAEWRASEAARLEQSLSDEVTEDRAWLEPSATPLALSLTRFIDEPDDASWSVALAEVDATATAAPLSARVALERLFRSRALEPHHEEAIRSASPELAAAWRAISERHHRLELAFGLIDLDPVIQPGIVSILERDPSLSLAQALDELRPDDESVSSNLG